MRIGILGSGLMGGKLGMIFARAGHEVIFSYARSEEKLKRLAREAKAKARHGRGRRPDPRRRVRSGRCRSFADRPLYRAVHDAHCPARLRGERGAGAGVPVRAVWKIGVIVGSAK